MKKLLALLLFTSALFANITVVKTPVLIDEPFEINSSKAQFDTRLDYTHRPLLQCQPELKAVYKIESSKKLKVIPTTELKSSTPYSCEYENQIFSFSTEPFTLENADYFKNEKILRLSFNDKINEHTLSEGVKLTRLDKLTKTNLNYTILQSTPKTFILKINEKVGNNPVQLSINKKLQNIDKIDYPTTYTKMFNSDHVELTLDKKKKALTITDAPRMVALKNGEFALRIFVNDNLTEKPEKAISIEGIENFKIGSYQYMGYKLRKEYNIENAYYYHDVSSKEFQPNSNYKVTFKKGLRTYYNELKEDIHYDLKTSNRAKVILFDNDKPYISNKGELSFSSINVNNATLIVERILDDNLRYFVNFAKANKKSVPKYTKEVFNKRVTLNQKPNEQIRQKFKLSDLSNDRLPVGVYKITLRYDELVNGMQKERSHSKVLFLSNLGITANISKEQAFISVLSLDKAIPVKNTRVELYGENNELLGTTQTNGSGIAIINYTENANNKPKGVIVRQGKESNFLALSKSIQTPSVSELYTTKERFKGHIHFQSNIVRPKAKINALLTIKDSNFVSASKLPIKVIFQELYGKKVHEKVYHTNKHGMIDFNYQLDANDRIGDYELRLFIGETMIGSKRLKVEAFMPPKIETKISTNKEHYPIKELINVNIRSSYLFGAPASYLPGKVTFNAQTKAYENPKYKGYSFSNDRLKENNIRNYIDRMEEITLDDKGEYTIVMNNTLRQRVPSILEAMLGVTIMDDAQPVASYKKINLYPYKEMVGLKLNQYSLKKGDKLEGSVVLINPENNTTVNRQLFATLKEVKWHYNYADGHYNWEKELDVVESFPIEANQKFSKVLTRNGEFILEIQDHLGGHSASQTFDVFSWNYTNISPSDNLKSIDVNFEDKLYSKGDEVEVSIKSPILEGRLLLTLEGEHVQNYKVLKIEKGVAKASLKIKEEMHQGLYLHATVIRSSEHDSKLIPFRASGYKFVKANREKHKIQISMDLPKTSKSKNQISLKLKTSKPSSLLISVVDKGILQLVSQEKPNIFDYFNEQPNKSLSYFDLYDKLMSHISEGKLIDFGAGDMLRLKQKHKAPDLGKRIKPFMLWSGIIENKSGKTELDIDIPEFNGQATVLAIAMSEDSIGVNAKDIVIKDDIMIKPSYPLYGRVGDNINVPVRLFNTTNIAKTLSLTSNYTDNLALELNQTKVTIPAKSSQVITMNLKPHKVGKGAIQLEATDKNQTVVKSVELPLHSPYALSTKSFKGISNQTETFTVPKAYEGAKAYINLSDNLIGALRNDLQYLISYPYGCAEQTASKLSAIHFAKPFLKEDKLLQNAKHFTLQGIKKLDNMQNYYGEFFYWESGSEISPYASLYTAQTLLELGELREGLEKKILKMLKSVATQNGNYQGSYSKFHQLYAAYILAENNKLSKSTANMLYENKVYKGHFLATFYMSAILKSMKEDAKADKLYHDNNYALEKYAYKTYGNITGNFESNVRDMLLHFIIKTKYFDKNQEDLNVIQREISNLYSTQEKAIALKAISTYLGQPKDAKVDTSLTINGKTSHYKKPTLIEIDTVTNGKIQLKPNSGSMSYTIELVKNLAKTLKNELSTQKAMSIKQEFIDANGMPVDLKTLRQGDKFFSQTTIVNYGKVNHVVVNQKVPSCLSIVNHKIQNQKARFKNKNIDLEHKEIQDDRVLHFINLRDKKVYNKGLKKDISVENRGILYTELLASSVGECQLPATIAEAMYDPKINDYAKVAKKIVVKPLEGLNKVTSTNVVKQPSIKKEAKALVQDLYTKEMHSNNALEFTKFFHFPLTTYFKDASFTKEALLEDKQKYFKAWTKRVYSNTTTEVVSYTKEDKKVKVGVSFEYKLYNGEKVLQGKSHHLVTLMRKDKALLITAIELFKK